MKNDPYQVLENSGIAKKMLSKRAVEALDIYDETAQAVKEFPKEKSFAQMAEQIAQEAINIIEQETAEFKKTIRDEQQKEEKQKIKKAQSEKMVEKSKQSMDYLEQCRIKLREERKRKLESGEIKAPVKKMLTTKLKEALGKIIKLMPRAIKDDPQKIKQTQKAIDKFLRELKEIWEMNKIKSIQDEIKEKTEKLSQRAEEKKEKSAA